MKSVLKYDYIRGGFFPECKPKEEKNEQNKEAKRRQAKGKIQTDLCLPSVAGLLMASEVIQEIF